MRQYKALIQPILFFVIPVLLYAAILLVRIPYAWTQGFQRYSFVAFVLVVLLYYGCFRLPGRSRFLAGLALTMILFGLTLSYKWSSGFSDNGVIGGLIPYKDGKNYYVGAQMLLNGSYIRADGLQAAWRPLSASLLASILFLTGQNLQLTIAILTGLTALCCFLAAYGMLPQLGPLPTAFFASLLFFWIQGFVGYALSEIPGFALGCLGFLFLWRAAASLRISDLVLGLVLLIIAVSARAGAFFVFPMLVLWAGWAFRGGERFSYRMIGIALLTVLVTIVAVNAIFPRLVVAAGGVANGNFAFAIYGQVKGGSGWHSALAELNTSNPSVIYRAAWQFFLAHPFSLVIGIAKSYRDVFWPNGLGLFPFIPLGPTRWYDTALWFVTLILLFAGFYDALKRDRGPHATLLAAGLIGISLSIPFLPPIDGGARFYASTMAFFLALPAYAVNVWRAPAQAAPELLPSRPLEALATVLLLLTLVLPPLLRVTRDPVLVTAPACPDGQLPYVIELDPRSYVNIVPDGVSACGGLPNVCSSDFVANGTEKSIDDFFQALMEVSGSSQEVTHLVPAVNLIDDKFHYFIGPAARFEAAGSNHLLAGCAVEIRTDNQRIYQVESSRGVERP
ncbi:MAG TPA: hypothetical protein VGJ22_04425 [Anaerolineales bacterium]